MKSPHGGSPQGYALRRRQPLIPTVGIWENLRAEVVLLLIQKAELKVGSEKMRVI